MNKQQGIGLPEILVGLLLSSFITMGLIRIYLNTKQQYHYIQTTMEQRLELRLVSDLIRHSIRRAGFTPCLGVEHLVSIDQRNPLKKLVAIEVGGSSIQMNRMDEQFDTILQRVDATTLLTTATHLIPHTQAIMVADCYHAEVQHIKEITQTSAGQLIALFKPLEFTYQAPIYVGSWLEETYFMQSRLSQKATLFYHLHHTEELATSIHHLSAHLEKNQGHILLRVILGLDNAHQLKLDTMVRNS
jgi:hypothetical protein